MGKTKYLSTFEKGMVVGAKRTGLSVSRTEILLFFLPSTVSLVYQEWSTTKRTSSQLDITVGSIGVNMGQHSCGMLSKILQNLATCSYTSVSVHTLCIPYSYTGVPIHTLFINYSYTSVPIHTLSIPYS